MSVLCSFSRRAPRLLGWVLLTACPGNGDGSGTDETGASTGGSSTADTPTGGGGPGIGAPCDHGGRPLEGDFVIFTLNETGCAGGICLYVEDETPPTNFCSADADCQQDSDDRFVCDIPKEYCIFDPAWKLERSQCSQFCESTADCVPDLSSVCAAGFSCEFVTGQCCDKVCVCLDDITPESFDLPKMLCETDPPPECNPI